MKKRRFASGCILYWLACCLLAPPACTKKPGATAALQSASASRDAPRKEETSVAFPGFVKAADEELVYPVSGLGWVFKITMLVDEGTMVKPGAQLVQFENEEDAKIKADAQREVETARLETDSRINTVQQEVADLVKSINDMKRQLEILSLSGTGNDKNETARWTTSTREITIARMDEKILRSKLTLTENKLTRKKHLLEATLESSAKRMSLLTAGSEKIAALMKSGTRYATRQGIVVYKRSPWEQKKPRPGATVYVGSPVLGVYDPRSLYVDGYVPERQYRQVAVGRAVIVRTLGGHEMSLPGVIEQVSGSVMPIKDWELTLPIPEKIAVQRTFKVKIKWNQPAQNLSPDDEVRVLFAAPEGG